MPGLHTKSNEVRRNQKYGVFPLFAACMGMGYLAGTLYHANIGASLLIALIAVFLFGIAIEHEEATRNREFHEGVDIGYSMKPRWVRWRGMVVCTRCDTQKDDCECDTPTS